MSNLATDTQYPYVIVNGEVLYSTELIERGLLDNAASEMGIRGYICPSGITMFTGVDRDAVDFNFLPAGILFNLVKKATELFGLEQVVVYNGDLGGEAFQPIRVEGPFACPAVKPYLEDLYMQVGTSNLRHKLLIAALAFKEITNRSIALNARNHKTVWKACVEGLDEFYFDMACQVDPYWLLNKLHEEMPNLSTSFVESILIPYIRLHRLGNK